jgi:hypothetical protein
MVPNRDLPANPIDPFTKQTKESVMIKMNGWAKALVVGSFLFGMSGCGLKEYFNCRSLCNKKKECTTSSYDVESCVDSCSDNANQSSDYARKVDTCKECVVPLSCGESAKMAACYVNCPTLP